MQLIKKIIDSKEDGICKGWAVFLLSSNALSLLKKDALDTQDILCHYYNDIKEDLGLEDVEFFDLEPLSKNYWEMQETITLRFEGTI